MAASKGTEMETEGVKKEENIVKKGHILEEFSEAEEIRQITDSLANIYKDQISVELAIERFTGKLNNHNGPFLVLYKYILVD